MSIFVNNYKSYLLPLVGFLCICLCGANSPTIRCLETERQSLLKFEHGFTGGSSAILSTWREEIDCCKWKGVSCNNMTSHVTMLDLHAVNLEGKIHPSICELKHLTYLDLTENSINHEIPKCLGSLGQLRDLKLALTGLSGSIPRELQNLSNLQTLDLGYNDGLTATDLEWVSHLSSLKYLNLTYVDLSHAVNWQSSISSKVPSLLELTLASCSLPHFYPKSLIHVNTSTTLKLLDLSGNDLSISILSWVLNVSKVLIHLDLSQNALEGPILDDFANMVSLEFLDLSRNKIEGGIPESFQHMCHLEELRMSDNEVGGKLSDSIQNLCYAQNTIKSVDLRDNPFSSGSFPDFSRFSSLEGLYLDNTSLNGLFPQSFGNFPHLVSLYLRDNNLSGPLPEFIRLPSLEWVILQNNQFSGVISEANLSNLPRLLVFDVSQNLLHFKLSPNWIPPFQLASLFASSCTLGPHFPVWLKNQRALWSLDISNAGISYSIPQWFWEQSSSLIYLNFSHNHIYGSLPNAFPPSLFHDFAYGVDLSFNNLSGPLPLFQQNCSFLILSRNMFSGSLSFFCTRLQPILSHLDLSNNLFIGKIPDCWEQFPELEILNLAHNNLSGRIPKSICSLQNIKTIHLGNNSLTGEMPFLEHCQQLRIIDFGENNLHGMLPTWIGRKLSNLIVLRLRANMLRGTIPISLCSLQNLQILDISQNSIAGSIPYCLNNISALSHMELSKFITSYETNDFLLDEDATILFDYHLFDAFLHHSFLDNAILRWKGEDYEYGKNLRFMRSIDLSNNQLIGEIPHSIANLLGLPSLNLSRNNLTGFIPDNFGQMTLLESLDLSSNSLSGTIPASFSNLSFLAYLNLSFNNFSGKIPSGTQLQSFDASAYMGNHGLCGPPLRKGCIEDGNLDNHTLGTTIPGEESEKDEDKLISSGFFVCMSLGFIIGFWGIFGTMILKSAWRQAYFQFLEKMSDWVCVQVALIPARIKRKMQG